MSGTGFSWKRGGSREVVTFQVPRKINEKFLSDTRANAVNAALLRRGSTCAGNAIAAADAVLVKTIFDQYSTGELKPNKTVKFELTEKCATIIGEFRANHGYITSEERAFQVLLTIGVMYGAAAAA